MKYIASCSFGKDSLATVIVALEHGEPLDEVLYCEVMFDEHTSGEVPEHRAFIYERAIPEIKAAGVKVTVIQSKKNLVGLFNKRVGKGANAGKIWSWPLCGKCYVQRDCKTRPLTAYKRSLGEIVQYIGIANDEDARIARLDGKNLVSILAKYEIDEDGAREICTAHGLLSPIYEFAPRNGCFFCPNAKYKERRHGSEFADVEGLERSCLRPGEKRTTVYYCHPYSSSERGSNEKQNGMLRRRHPKGTDFKRVSRKKLRETTDWINNYPRKIFGFHTAAELFAAAFPGLPALY